METNPAKIETPKPNGDVLGRQWAALSAAMEKHDRNAAELFCQAAYECVEAGLIRLDDRRALAQAARELGIRDFDAQLLIACAIRKWALDHRYDPRPNPNAPRLSFEYKSWPRAWMRFAVILGMAMSLDAVILYHWLGN
jgi:hypothetical protein